MFLKKNQPDGLIVTRMLDSSSAHCMTSSCLPDFMILYWRHDLSSEWVGVLSSKVVVTINHVDRSFNLFNNITRNVGVIPSFRTLDYMLYVGHISCGITNCGQHQWVNTSPLSIALYALLEENITTKMTTPSCRHVLQHFAIPDFFP